MSISMTLKEAKEECRRWLEHCTAQEKRSYEMQKLAKDRRDGNCDELEMRRRKRKIEKQPTVYDGSKLQDAVRVLLNALEF